MASKDQALESSPLTGKVHVAQSLSVHTACPGPWQLCTAPENCWVSLLPWLAALGGGEGARVRQGFSV